MQREIVIEEGAEEDAGHVARRLLMLTKYECALRYLNLELHPCSYS